MDRKLETSQVAKRFNVTARTVRNWAAAGVFPGAFRVGSGSRRFWRIPESSLAGLVVTPELRDRARSTTREGDDSAPRAEETEDTEETEGDALRRGRGVGQIRHVRRGSPLRSNPAVNPRPSPLRAPAGRADCAAGARR